MSNLDPRIHADLHSHTTASDGELSPTQLVERAAANGLAALAVTDHDSVAGVDEALAAGQRLGVEVVAGCELTIYEGGVERHLLGLFIDHRSAPFTALMQSFREGRRRRALEMIRRIKDAGFAVEEADLFAAAGSADAIGKPHVAEALLRRGIVRTADEAHRKFLSRGCIADVPKVLLTPDEAFAAIRAAGGLSFLAHPGFAPHDELIAPFFRRGMDGVEALYLKHSEVNRRFYAGLANRYEKLVSGGSDFHGPIRRPSAELGAGGVDRVLFTRLKALAASRKHAQ